MLKLRTVLNAMKRKNANANNTPTVIEGVSATEFTSNNVPLNIGKVTLTLDDNDTIMNDIENLVKNAPTPERENDCLSEEEVKELIGVHLESMNDIDVETEDNVLTMEEAGNIDDIPMKEDNMFEEQNIIEGEYGKIANDDYDGEQGKECSCEGKECKEETCAVCGGCKENEESYTCARCVCN